MSPRHEIRSARESDAAALAALAERTFRDAFGADNEPEDMDQHCAKNFGRDIQAGEIMNPKIRTFVADLEGALIGLGQLRRSEPPSGIAAVRPLEIQRLYVDREWHGSGVAQALMRVMLDSAARDRADRVWLGVWERNARAIAFYKRCGFETVGEHVFALGSDLQCDLVMVRPVGLHCASS